MDFSRDSSHSEAEVGAHVWYIYTSGLGFRVGAPMAAERFYKHTNGDGETFSGRLVGLGKARSWSRFYLGLFA